jgi:hypothetical protein
MELFMIFYTMLYGVMVVVIVTVLADRVLGSNGLATSRRAANKVVEILEKRGMKEGIFVDFGSAAGWLSLFVAKRMPGLKVVGIEQDKLRVVISRMRAKVRGIKNAQFLSQDVFSSQLNDADVVYVFLPKDISGDMAEFLRARMRKGAIAIVNTFPLPLWEPVEIIPTRPERKDGFETLRVYMQKEKLYR